MIRMPLSILMVVLAMGFLPLFYGHHDSNAPEYINGGVGYGILAFVLWPP